MTIVNNILIDMVVSDYRKALSFLTNFSVKMEDKITYCYENQNKYRDLSIFSWLHHGVDSSVMKSIWEEFKINADYDYINYLMNDLVNTCIDTVNIKLLSLSLNYCKDMMNNSDYLSLKESILYKLNCSKEVKKLEYLILNNNFYEECISEKIIKKLVNYGDPQTISLVDKKLNLKNKKEFFGYALVKFYSTVIYDYNMGDFLERDKQMLVFLIKNNFATNIIKTDLLFEEIEQIRYSSYSSRFHNELLYQADFFEKGESVSHILNNDVEHFIELKEICIAFENKLLACNINCETNRKGKERL